MHVFNNKVAHRIFGWNLKTYYYLNLLSKLLGIKNNSKIL